MSRIAYLVRLWSRVEGEPWAMYQNCRAISSTETKQLEPIMGSILEVTGGLRVVDRFIKPKIS